jgi:hypothetical protein
MSGSAKPAASRTGKAAGPLSNRASRLDKRAWRDVKSAIELGKKHDVHAVEIHGVRFVFRGAQQPQVETTGGRSANTRASSKRVEPASAPAARKAAPNSAQRRSARRLQKYMEAKKGSGPAEAQTQHPPSIEPQSEGVASVEPDVRADAITADVPSPGKRRLSPSPEQHDPLLHTTLSDSDDASEQPEVARPGWVRRVLSRVGLGDG